MTKPACLALTFATVFVFSTASHATQGRAVIRSSENTAEYGRLDLKDTTEGLRVSGSLTGLPPGKHAFHIHEFGACDDSGNAAGSHYNPLGAPHGHLAAAGEGKAHAG